MCNITLSVTLKGSYKDSPDFQRATLKDSSWILSDPADPCQLSGSIFISHSPTVTILTRLSFRVASRNSDCWFLSTSRTTFEKDVAVCTEKVEWRRNQIGTHLLYLHQQRTEHSLSEDTFYHSKEHTGAYKQQGKFRNFGLLALQHSRCLLLPFLPSFPKYQKL